ncbi:MAG: glycosyltransferase family 2 protein [Gluconacetobacter diazotrophicus]|nr:glycosyltransferase family 2 protein [Gluconacetobacter diazotrophicus]
MPTVVAIPARDEEDRIGPCLRALIQDAVRPPDHVLVLVNNASDATAARARSWPAGTRTGIRTAIHVVERVLPPPLASAGHARRIAMDLAAGLAGPDGLLFTTDADGRVDPSWLSAAVALLQRDLDLVAGWIELEPAEWAAIPMALHEDDARECEYDALCDRIHDRLDPDPHDPLPRHTQNSGASLATTVAAFRRCGGVPPVSSGEDRALVEAMRRIDARIRHAPEMHGFVSGRLQGRATGGMAETIARRMSSPDTHLDDRLEPVDVVVLRATSRRLARRAFDGRRPSDLSALAEVLALSPDAVSRALDRSWFGTAWFELARLSPRLLPRRVPVADLPREVAAARAVLGSDPPAAAAASPEPVTGDGAC